MEVDLDQVVPGYDGLQDDQLPPLYAGGPLEGNEAIPSSDHIAQLTEEAKVLE
jgi:hypothetical protein